MSDAELRIDDYLLVNLIASGHASQVWEVHDAGGQGYAMKLLLPDAFKNQDQINVLKHEAKVGQQFDHPNLIRSIKFVKTKTHCYKLMELFRCPSLKNMLQSESTAVQSRFSRLVEQLCIALGYMHDKGWLHHDLKPDNILFSKASELKLIDYSLAMRRQGGLGKVFAGKVKVVQGTRTYIAPETIRKQYPTVQSEIYSLGVTLFEVLTGQPPFVGNTPNDLLIKHLSAKPPEPSIFNPNVTPEADKAILRLLSKKPAHRPKDMAEVGAEFRSLKIFKRDPIELAAEEDQMRKEEGLGLSAKSRLDSRADAARTAAGIAPPPRPEPRKPSPAALKAAKGKGSPTDQPAYPQPQYAPGQPAPYPGYDAAAAWAAYAQQGYSQGHWPQYAQPQYGQPQGVPQQGYYPQSQGGGQYPQSHEPPQNLPSQQPPSSGQQWAQPASAQQPIAAPADAPGNPAAETTPTSAPSPAETKPAPPTPARNPVYLPGMGRANLEKHPTQENIDPNEIPLMEADELPDVL
ncbi:MAG: protein kinase [Planctomycetaceae bacterium]